MIDTNAAIQHLQQVDPVLAKLITVCGPCTLEAQGDLFLTLVDAIVSQQLSVKASATILGRVEALCAQGGRLAPEGILARSEEELRAAGLSRQKVRYLIDLATRVQQGSLDLEAIRHEPDELVIEHLTQVKGIGRWTAEMFLIFALGRLDVLPVDDLGLLVAVQRAYGLKDKPSKAKLSAMAERWQPYRTVATWYLWRSRDALPAIEYGVR